MDCRRFRTFSLLKKHLNFVKKLFTYSVASSCSKGFPSNNISTILISFIDLVNGVALRIWLTPLYSKLFALST